MNMSYSQTNWINVIDIVGVFLVLLLPPLILFPRIDISLADLVVPHILCSALVISLYFSLRGHGNIYLRQFINTAWYLGLVGVTVLACAYVGFVYEFAPLSLFVFLAILLFFLSIRLVDPLDALVFHVYDIADWGFMLTLWLLGLFSIFLWAFLLNIPRWIDSYSKNQRNSK
jgi:predicted membrane channel-forming protein YqfA (hemolysin III family)